MERQFDRELESLKTMLMKMGSVVEESIAKALQAIATRDPKLARVVVETDQRVDDLEVEIDNAIIDLLALRQPLASDLRFIIVAQKINNDLERIGDHAVNLAQAVDQLMTKQTDDMLDLPEMSDIAKRMLHDVLDSFILGDPERAKAVLQYDDRIDLLNREMGKKVVAILRKNEQPPECGLELMRISRNLERIADLATNIAEEVIYQKQARIVKHHADERSHGGGTV